MESLSYAYDGRKSPFENLGRIKNPLQKPDDNSLSVPLSTIVNNSTQFSEDGWSEMSRKSFLSHPQSLETSYIDTNSRCNKPKPTQEPPSPAKRAKVTNTPSSAPTCQVLGCNKDLSSSKDYHKRHKVCDVHSKTAMVIVNGKEQRFCQQCSRFHVLPEFDEGKRSCRKRLAGHNERRRKPQLESYFGSSYFSTNASKTSSILPRAFPPSFYYPQCNNKTIIHNSPLKLEHSPIQIPSHPIPISNPRKVSPTKRGLNNTPSPVPEASVGSTNSSCALSLLSSQSNDLLNNSMSENVTPVIICPSQIVGQHQSETQTSHLSPEGSHTVSLVELSLYLQKVEQQKYYEKLCL